MPEIQTSHRKVLKPKQQQVPTDPFNYGIVVVGLAAAAAVTMVLMLRQPSEDVQNAPLRTSELPQIN